MNETGRGGRLAAGTAVAGTVLIAAGAFWLSFTALADLARRSGIEAGQAWAWPLIVDGIIVVATVAVVALSGSRQAWYPWMLLIAGAGLSVAANSIHAIVAADADVPAFLAAAVAAVPPLVLLAITHLTVILTPHPAAPEQDDPETASAEAPVDMLAVPAASAVATFPLPASPALPAPERAREPSARRGGAGDRELAEALRVEGWSNRKIARHFGVHPSTIGRWFAPTGDPDRTELDAAPEFVSTDPEAEEEPS